jgi:hypothetical protein
MSRLTRTRAFFFPLLLVFACGSEPTGPVPLIGSGPTFTFTNNPDNGNPRIVRFEDLFAFLTVDPQTNLFAQHSPFDFQFFCNGSPTLFNLMDFQDVLQDPDDPLAGQIKELILGRDIYIGVFEGWDEWVASGFDCADLFSRKLAEGPGNVTSTDNDLLTFLRESTNGNAFGFAAQGRLERVGGGTAHYSGTSRCIWQESDGHDAASFFRCTEKINFR